MLHACTLVFESQPAWFVHHNSSMTSVDMLWVCCWMRLSVNAMYMYHPNSEVSRIGPVWHSSSNVIKPSLYHYLRDNLSRTCPSELTAASPAPNSFCPFAAILNRDYVLADIANPFHASIHACRRLSYHLVCTASLRSQQLLNNTVITRASGFSGNERALKVNQLAIVPQGSLLRPVTIDLQRANYSRKRTPVLGHLLGLNTSMTARVQANAQPLCSCVIASKPGFSLFRSASFSVRGTRSLTERPRQQMGALWSRPAAPELGRRTHSVRAAAVDIGRSSATFVVSLAF